MNISNILIKYIEDNKKYDIDYKKSIETIEELLKELKKDYEELEEE